MSPGFVECLYVPRVRISRLDLRDHIDEFTFANGQSPASVDASVAALFRVRFHAWHKRRRPTLKLEGVVGRQRSGVVESLGHADKFNVVPKAVEVAFNALLDHFAGIDANVYPYPFAVEILCSVNCRAAPAKWIENNIIWTA